MGTVVTLAGLLSQGRTAPRLCKAFAKYGYWRIQKMLRRLKIQGLIEYDAEDEYAPIYLTDKGFARKIKDDLRHIQGKKWDHFWRLVMFDIPKRKRTRDAFQKTLKRIGFFQLQKSVYVYPFDCHEQCTELMKPFQIRPHVVIATTPNLGHMEKQARAFYFQKETRG